MPAPAAVQAALRAEREVSRTDLPAKAPVEPDHRFAGEIPLGAGRNDLLPPDQLRQWDVTHASAPGSADKANEDGLVFGRGTMVLLDGAGTPPGADSGCADGVPWYVGKLSTALHDIAADRTPPLRDSLNAAIAQVKTMHPAECDVEHPGSPSATAAR